MASEPKIHPSAETALLEVRSNEIAFSRFRVQVTAGPDAGRLAGRRMRRSS